MEQRVRNVRDGASHRDIEKWHEETGLDKYSGHIAAFDLGGSTSYAIGQPQRLLVNTTFSPVSDFSVTNSLGETDRIF